jgi:2-dehydro-3-deoxyphosphogalactonate aldolase
MQMVEMQGLSTPPTAQRSSTSESPGRMDFELELPLIAILRGIRPEETLDHVGALIAAGFGAIEIPLNSPDWQLSIERAIEHFGDRAWIGGGTVLTNAQVDTLSAMGACLVVTPNTRPSLIGHAVGKGLRVAAGIATPSEAFEALDAGAQALKIFPATTFGPGFVRAIRAVLPPVPLLAVGGITPGNLGDYLRAGCTGAGLGSDLYQPAQPVSRTEAMARTFIQAYREAAP